LTTASDGCGDSNLLPERSVPRRSVADVRAELAGRKVMVPHEMWPDEECNGHGWLGKVLIVSRDLTTVKVAVDSHTYMFPLEEVLKWRRL